MLGYDASERLEDILDALPGHQATRRDDQPGVRRQAKVIPDRLRRARRGALLHVDAVHPEPDARCRHAQSFCDLVAARAVVEDDEAVDGELERDQLLVAAQHLQWATEGGIEERSVQDSDRRSPEDEARELCRRDRQSRQSVDHGRTPPTCDRERPTREPPGGHDRTEQATQREPRRADPVDTNARIVGERVVARRVPRAQRRRSRSRRREASRRGPPPSACRRSPSSTRATARGRERVRSSPWSYGSRSTGRPHRDRGKNGRSSRSEM